MALGPPIASVAALQERNYISHRPAVVASLNSCTRASRFPLARIYKFETNILIMIDAKLQLELMGEQSSSNKTKVAS